MLRVVGKEVHITVSPKACYRELKGITGSEITSENLSASFLISTLCPLQIRCFSLFKKKSQHLCLLIFVFLEFPEITALGGLGPNRLLLRDF